MGKTAFHYEKNSAPPQTNWQDDGRINLIAFANEDDFKSFGVGLGISEELLNTRGTGGLAGVFATYAQLAGDITLSVMIGKYSLTHLFGLKKGQTGSMNVNPGSYYLTIFNNLSWTLYYNELSHSNGTHNILIDSNLNVSIS